MIPSTQVAPAAVLAAEPVYSSAVSCAASKSPSPEAVVTGAISRHKTGRRGMIPHCQCSAPAQAIARLGAEGRKGKKHRVEEPNTLKCSP